MQISLLSEGNLLLIDKWGLPGQGIRFIIRLEKVQARHNGIKRGYYLRMVSSSPRSLLALYITTVCYQVIGKNFQTNNTKESKLLRNGLMALLTKEQKKEKTSIRIKIDQNLKKNLDDYCSWAGIEDMNHFFAEAAKIVLEKDKEWRNYKAGSLQTNFELA